MDHRPLKPVGEWLGESFRRLGGRWATLTALFVFGGVAMVAGVGLVYTIGIACIGFLQGWDNLARIATDPRKIGYFFEASRGAFTLFGLLAALVALRMYAWVLQAAVHASLDASLGFRGALRKGKDRGYAFLALLVVQQALLQAGAMLLLLPGLILAVWVGFALWAFARDGAGIFRSMGDSARAVRGHFFGVLGRMILAGLIGGMIMIVPVAGWLVGGAWMLVAWGGLYEDLSPVLPKPGVARPPRVAPARVAA